MRRFSQKNQLVTLSEINITPLLDLAFVLLIIFVITTPLLENSMDLKLPQGGRPPNSKIDPKNIRTVEIDRSGHMKLGGRSVTLPEVEQQIAREFRSNPNLIVGIRADGDTRWENGVKVWEACIRVGIPYVAVKMEPPRR